MLDKSLASSLSVKIKKYKCFGTKFEGIPEIKPINIIIGRNNSGKSALLDMLEMCIGGRVIGDAQIQIGIAPPEAYYQQQMAHRFRPYGQVEQMRERYKQSRITKVTTDFRNFSEWSWDLGGDISQDLPRLSNNDNPFLSLTSKRINAERQVSPEVHGAYGRLEANGNGTVDIYRRFYNEKIYSRDIIEVKILNDLNSIFSPDLLFESIAIRQEANGAQSPWEIYLKEKDKGLISVSDSGTGIKTALLVLAYIHLVPVLENISLSSYVFLFEELENNLHPAMQRKLHAYIRSIAAKDKCIFFLTTHSGVVIDQHCRDQNAQIIHVTHDRKFASVKVIRDYTGQRNIIDDLDIRASDLLQSNGLVWVEGPSDRLYFNQWINLYTNGKLKEGLHYECITYGGKLLAHFSAANPLLLEQKEFINILSINRNFIFLIDSDVTAKRWAINDTKKRIKRDIEGLNGFCWITHCKEVENYIPDEVLKKLYPNQLNSLQPREKIEDYLNQIDNGLGEKYKRGKVAFAESVVPLLTREGLATNQDLHANIIKCIKNILSWNRMSDLNN
jgi:predicted ATPase